MHQVNIADVAFSDKRMFHIFACDQALQSFGCNGAIQHATNRGVNLFFLFRRSVAETFIFSEMLQDFSIVFKRNQRCVF